MEKTCTQFDIEETILLLKKHDRYRTEWLYKLWIAKPYGEWLMTLIILLFCIAWTFVFCFLQNNFGSAPLFHVSNIWLILIFAVLVILFIIMVRKNNLYAKDRSSLNQAVLKAAKAGTDILLPTNELSSETITMFMEKVEHQKKGFQKLEKEIRDGRITRLSGKSKEIIESMFTDLEPCYYEIKGLGIGDPLENSFKTICDILSNFRLTTEERAKITQKGKELLEKYPDKDESVRQLVQQMVNQLEDNQDCIDRFIKDNDREPQNGEFGHRIK